MIQCVEQRKSNGYRVTWEDMLEKRKLCSMEPYPDHMSVGRMTKYCSLCHLDVLCCYIFWNVSLLTRNKVNVLIFSLFISKFGDFLMINKAVKNLTFYILPPIFQLL